MGVPCFFSSHSFSIHRLDFLHQFLRMAKGCKHISCLSITKLTEKVQNDGLTWSPTSRTPDDVEEDWVCAVCLHVFFNGTGALAHGRKHNHQIFYKSTLDGKEGSGFFCATCGKDVDEGSLTAKHKSVIEDAGELLKNGLKQKPKEIIKSEGEGDHARSESEVVLRPSGLVNLGNTCFLNSALQALSAVLLSLMPSTDSEADSPSLGPIGTSLLGTLRCIPSTVVPGQQSDKNSPLKKKRTSPRYGNIVDPSTFLSSISKRYKEFKRLRQQDSHDFLRLLFNALDDEHKTLHGKEKVKAIHQEFFSGKQTSRVVCKACKNSTEVEEAFMDLSLAIPPLDDEVEGLIKQMRSLSTEDLAQDDFSLLDLLHFWSRPAQLANENAFACENCAKLEAATNEEATRNYIYRPATLQFMLKEAPPCLIIHLQRFSVTGVGKRGVRLSKDHTHISIPSELDLSRFGCAESCVYRLTAMVIHEGSSVDSGHYVAVVRYGEDGWWHASDTSVRRLQGTLANYNPYLLFYTRT